MPLNFTRLATNMSAAIKADIISQFSSYWSGLKPTELASLNAALQKFTDSIANGDSITTVAEIDVNATLNIPANNFGVLPGTFTNGAGAVTGEGENDTILLTGVID